MIRLAYFVSSALDKNKDEPKKKQGSKRTEQPDALQNAGFGYLDYFSFFFKSLSVSAASQ